jgi:hypothetical protein
MTFIEFFTTYLAVGAPFGVYYFLKHRRKLFGIALLAKSIATALLWFLFAVRLLRQWSFSSNSVLRRSNRSFSLENKIEGASQNVLNIFAAISREAPTPSFFEFRETLERYVGLTLAAEHSSVTAPVAKREIEIFRVVGYEPRALQLAGKIIHRTNYLRLKSHQSLARHDFLQVCRSLKGRFLNQSNSKLEIWQQYQTEVMRLFDLLGDLEAMQTLLNWCEISLIEPAQFNNNNKQDRDVWIAAQTSPLIKTFPITVPSHTRTIGAQD